MWFGWWLRFGGEASAAGSSISFIFPQLVLDDELNLVSHRLKKNSTDLVTAIEPFMGDVYTGTVYKYIQYSSCIGFPMSVIFRTVLFLVGSRRHAST